MNPMQNGQQNPYQSQMHPMTQARMMPMNNNMNNMQQPMNQYPMGMNSMNSMNMNSMNVSQMQQMQMMMRQQNQQSQQRYYNRTNQMQNTMPPNNMRNNLQTMNLNGTRSSNNPSTNQQSNHSNNANASSNNNSSSNNNNNANKGPTKDTWRSPFKNRDQNIDFFMYAYKCQPCPLRRNCQSKVTCPGWHHEGEKRRNPGEEPNFLYSEEPCPNVKPQGSNKWQPPSRCTDGDECGYSHTLLEQMYHPNIYKTSMCINFTNPQGNKCQWGFYCTHAHGQEDIRNPNKKQSVNSDKDANGENGESSTTNAKKNGKQETSRSPDSNSTKKSNNPSQPSIKRARSQSDAPKMLHSGHLRSPQFAEPMLNAPSHGSRSHQLPGYNSYHSPNHMNSSNTSPSRVRGSDFSPLPFQANAVKQYSNNPPPLHLHEDNNNANNNNNMYSAHPQHSYHSEQSYLGYHQTQKRHRSISADTGLVPYMGSSKVSQQPNIPNMYNRYHHQQPQPQQQQQPHQQQHHHHELHSHPQQQQHIPDTTLYTSQSGPTPDELHGDLPMLNASRVSRQFNEKGPQSDKHVVNNTSTPPPPTAKQAKHTHSFLNGDMQFYDPSNLQPPRATRSLSAIAGKDDRYNPYLPDPALLDTKVNRMGKLQFSSSLPSYAKPSKVPPLPGQETSEYYFAKPPSDLGQRKRHRSESEPLMFPPLPNGQYNLMSDSIWRTNPNQEPGSLSNPNKVDSDHADGRPKASDPFSIQQRLTSIPDGHTTLNNTFSKDSMLSPSNPINIDIATPRGILSPDSGRANAQCQADWDYFGFKQEDVQAVMSPIVDDPKDIKKNIDVPPTPTPPPEEGRTKPSKDEMIRKLKKELEAAVKQINALKDEKVPKLERASKNSLRIIKMENDDVKETTEDTNESKEELTELQRQQLLRYKHFITCPACQRFDPLSPRNQVLIPCGHLVCGTCSSGTQSKHRCPLCDDVITDYQLLLIG